MKKYSKIAFLFRNPGVRKELKTLDPVHNHQRMVQLLTGYEFPFDMVRALELALFHTYASPSISSLLQKTGEFVKRGQKRYDDTSILIAQFMQEGYDSELGQRAIDRMNKIHGHYPIPNEDYLLVLATFVIYPIDWMEKYGWRKMTTDEKQALFLFFREVGKRMSLTDIPETLSELRAFADDYENRHFRYTESNRAIADATVRVVENWFPGPLRPVVKPVFAGLINAKLREAFGYRKPPAAFCALIEGSLQLRKWQLKFITFKSYPTLIGNTHWRTYPKHEFTLETLGPPSLNRKIPKQ